MRPPHRPGAIAPRAAVVGLVIVAGCEQIEQVQDGFRDLTPYEAYEESLAAAGLAETALGKDWLAAGRAAVAAPIPVTVPFEEEGFLAAEEPGAVAYLVSVPRGRRLTVDVDLSSDEGTRVFVELFRVAEDEGDPPRPIFSTDSLPGSFTHEPWRGGDFILRVQPELLRGGRYHVGLQLDPQLAFPVDGQSMRAVQSIFGADRDGGRRTHDGVDIFARRGTPVLAAAPGIAYRIGVTNLGGKVVWVRDPLRNFRLYYAHLDSQNVRDGDHIQVGDTLGFVGNTGNARTTPPHLHFGIYGSGEGAVDPVPFLAPPRGTAPELTADVGWLGERMRLVGDEVQLRAEPWTRAPVLRELPRHTTLRVLGASGEYYRVQLPDGADGYVAARLTEPLDEPYATQMVRSGQGLQVRPDQASPLVAALDSDADLPVLGRYEGYLYVRSPSGRPGWIEALGAADGGRTTQQ